MYIQEQEEREFHHDSLADVDRFDAMLYAAEHPEVAWVSGGMGGVYANPYYTGPEVPHPESY